MIVFVSCAPSQVRAWLIVGGATPFIRLFQASAVDGSTLEGLLARHGHTQVEPPCVSGLRYASPGQALSVVLLWDAAVVSNACMVSSPDVEASYLLTAMNDDGGRPARSALLIEERIV